MSDTVPIIAESAFVDLQVGPTNADMTDLNQDVAWPHFGHRNFPKFGPAFVFNHDCFISDRQRKINVLGVFRKVKAAVAEPTLTAALPLIISEPENFFQTRWRPVRKRTDGINRHADEKPAKFKANLRRMLETNPESGDRFTPITIKNLIPFLVMNVINGGLRLVMNYVAIFSLKFGPFNIFQTKKIFVKIFLLPKVFANSRIGVIGKILRRAFINRRTAKKSFKIKFFGKFGSFVADLPAVDHGDFFIIEMSNQV